MLLEQQVSHVRPHRHLLPARRRRELFRVIEKFLAPPQQLPTILHVSHVQKPDRPYVRRISVPQQVPNLFIAQFLLAKPKQYAKPRRRPSRVSRHPRLDVIDQFVYLVHERHEVHPFAVHRPRRAPAQLSIVL